MKNLLELFTHTPALRASACFPWKGDQDALRRGDKRLNPLSSERGGAERRGMGFYGFVAMAVMLWAPSNSAMAAGCEYHNAPGKVWIASDSLSFQDPECPTGTVAAPSYIKATDAATCGTGFTEVVHYKEVVCDSSRGTCSASIVCPVP